MFKKTALMQSMLVAMLAPTAVLADVTASFEFKNETAFFTKDGQKTGEATGMLDDSTNHSAGDMFKFQNQLKAYINGTVGEESTWHAELQIIYDSEAVNDSDNGGVNYKAHEEYTQNDFFRELYMDTSAGGWDWRLGKQQVVWGTADGIKLLDIINPTDFRELNQNGVEDSRIPIWMINGEKYFDDGSNLQVIVAEAENNKIPGLNAGGDAGHPFIMKGVETITGQVNGFSSIAPNLTNVAASFQGAAMGGGFTGGNQTGLGLNMFSGLTVDMFARGPWDITTPGLINPGTAAPDFADPTNTPGYAILNNFAQNGFTGQPNFPPGLVDPNGNYTATNQTPVTGTGFTDTSWDSSEPTSAFEHMGNATFATFNTFTGFDPSKPTGLGGMTQETQYVTEKEDGPNAGFRFKKSLDSGLNFSVNYFYHYSQNPGIYTSWHDANTGAKLTTQYAPTDWTDANGNGQPDMQDFYTPNTNVSLTRAQARANHDLGNPTNILLHDGTGSTYYGALDPSVATAGVADGNPFNEPPTPGAGAPVLRFTEAYHRVHSLGGSFDMAVDGLDVPLILRGEFLYDKDEKQPVVDKYLLSLGDIENAFTMEDADFFKYVIGADITVMTNLLVSAQFIQFWNLDYVDRKDTCTTGAGAQVDCSIYTADFATMSPTNGLNKGWETKEFVSLFFSKPIGEEQLGRWNNIFIWEEGGGYWNRLDAEYSVSDQLVVSAQWNNYWGDKDTTFGQFDKSSNVQVGFKYIFEEY